MKIYVNGRDMKVFFSVTHRGKRFYLYTGLQTTEKFEGMVFPKSDKANRAKTMRLANLYTSAESYLAEHPEETVGQMKEHLKEIVTGVKKESDRSLVAYIMELASEKEKYNTRRNYERLARTIEKYDKDCTLDSIDRKWAESYIRHEEKKGRKPNGIATDLQILKAVFHVAIDNELTDRFPMHGVSVKREQTRKRSISVEQLRALRDFPLHGKKAMYRDCFMLGFYLIGINISDLLFLPKSALKNGRITYKRNKTGRLYDIKVEPEAMEIIQRHKSRKRDRLLSFLEEGNATITNTFAHNLAANLRNVGHGEKRGNRTVTVPIESGITSYWNRHTWATIAAEIDIPMEIIGRSLGHSIWDRQVTSVYIKFDTKKIDEANRAVIDYVNGTE